MKTVAKYWSLVRLDSSGKVKITEITPAKDFFQQEFTNSIPDDQGDIVIQKNLLVLSNAETGSMWAQRCLRCFISHQIQQICLQLAMQFGREYGFTSRDLFIYTLNDTLDNFRDGVQPRSQFKPLAVEILETFNPEKANLATWTTRIVKQNRELQRFLLEQGVYLISNWAILNDTNAKQVQKILSEFHNLTPIEIQQCSLLLSAYHTVYRRDRLKDGLSQGRKCQTPSNEQLERIASLISEQSDLVDSAAQTLSQLEQLASLLREYRIHVRGGKMKQESWDNTEINTEAMQANLAQPEEEVTDRSEWLKSYQQEFQQSLNRAIEQVISNRLNKFKGKKAAKATQFMTALELFHCQGESMGAIAPVIDLQAQYQVTRLLQLKELRADIRQTMLQLMSNWVVKQTKFADPQLLKQREAEIEVALGEQIDLVVAEAEKDASIADPTRSILAKRICDYLDRTST
jgi:hypothetical protein